MVAGHVTLLMLNEIESMSKGQSITTIKAAILRSNYLGFENRFHRIDYPNLRRKQVIYVHVGNSVTLKCSSFNEYFFNSAKLLNKCGTLLLPILKFDSMKTVLETPWKESRSSI